MIDYLDFLFDNYFFNRPVKDMTPYKIVEKDDEMVIILNTLGVNPDDIEVTADNGDTDYPLYLKICGKTMNKVTEKEHSISMKFAVAKSIKDVEWESKDGLTYLHVKFVEPEKPKISINRKMLVG